MKYTLLFILLALGVDAQTPVTYTEVVNVDSTSQADLYNRTRLWFYNTYSHANKVLILDDRENGEFIGEGAYIYQCGVKGGATTTGPVVYRVNVSLKDNKSKITLSDFTHSGTSQGQYQAYNLGLLTTDSLYSKATNYSGKWYNSVWFELKEQTNDHASQLIKSFRQAVTTDPAAKKEDW